MTIQLYILACKIIKEAKNCNFPAPDAPSLLRLTHVWMIICDEFPDSLFRLGACSWPVLVHLFFQSILSFVPVKQSAENGGETVLSQRAHGAYQLRESDVQTCTVSIPA